MPEMTEPQTLDEVMDEASMTQESEAETQPSNEAETQEESYTRIDPKTLPPELQAMHKSLLRDYTKKTQSLAQMRREIEQRQSATQEPQYQEQSQVQQPVANQVDLSRMSVDEYTAYMISQVDEKISAYQQRVLQEQEAKYLEKAVLEFEATDERLNPESPAYDEDMRTAVGLKLDKALTAYTQENGTSIGFDYNSATKDLIEEYEQKLHEKASQIAAKRTQEAFKGVKRTAPTSTKSSNAPSKPSGKMSLDEALDTAFSN